jgi:hypothetical protein
MKRTLALVTCLAVLPAVTFAQRGGGGRTQADRHTPLFDKDAGPSGPTLRPRDLEEQSPVKLLIDKRKDLKLTDEQVNALKAAESQLKDKNAPLLKAIDSLVREMKPPLNPSDESKARMRDASAGLASTIRDIRANYDEAVKPILATLEAESQAKANDMLAKQKEEGEKTVREKMGGGRKG